LYPDPMGSTVRSSKDKDWSLVLTHDLGDS
jgi:hypothetical protein